MSSNPEAPDRAAFAVNGTHPHVEADPPATPQVHVLENQGWRVGLLPGTGGSVAFGQVRGVEGWVDLLRPAPGEGFVTPEDCGSFVMLPWSNRIGRAQLRFRGERHRLRVNADDGTAIHGTARDFPWEVSLASRSAIAMSFDSREFCGVNYPWPFSATITYRLAGRRLTISTEICNQHSAPVPVGFGHHPYFARSLAGPEDAAHLELPFTEYFPLQRALPSGPALPVDARVDFRALRPLGDAFVDDCLTGRLDGAPVRIVYPESGRTVCMGFGEEFTHAVVYIPRDGPYFAVEPVTNANDAFSLHERGVPGSGLVVLEPDEGLRAEFWLEAS